MLDLAAMRIFSYSLVPIKIATVIGVLFGLSSFVLAGFLVIRKFALGGLVPGWTSIILLMLFLFGVNFIFVGPVGEYLGRVYLESGRRAEGYQEAQADHDEGAMNLKRARAWYSGKYG